MTDGQKLRCPSFERKGRDAKGKTVDAPDTRREAATPKTVMIDSTYLKAHRTATAPGANVWPAPSASDNFVMT